jgi:1-acyl-sn-glycerol-3-phosphate acyltransferase
MNEKFNYRRPIEIGVLPNLLFNIRIDRENRERLRQNKELLKDRANDNLVIFFNHISFNDPVFIFNLLNRLDPKQTRTPLALVSHFHTNPDRPQNKNFIRMVAEAEKCGLKTYRIIQKYQIDNPEYGYTEEEAFSNHFQMLRWVKEESKHNKVAMIISPEGTRSPDGTLQVANPGIVAIAKCISPDILLPVGLWYPYGYNRDSYNIRKTVNCTLGEATLYDKSSDDLPTLDDLMYKLTATLPPELHGAYAQS